MEFSKNDIRSYLLGKIAADREQAIDLVILEGDALDDRVARVESELIDEYLRAELDAEELRAFKSTYLSSPARTERVREIRDLMLLSSELVESGQPNRKLAADRPTAPLWSWFRPIAVAAVILVVAGAIGYLFIGKRASQLQLEPEFVRLNAQGIRDADVDDAGARINLVPGLSRGSGTLPSYSATARNVVIAMALPYLADAKGKLNAKISTETDVVLSIDLVKPQLLKDDGIVRMLLPGNALKPGQYQIELSNASDKIIAKYYFNVVQ